ncbi:MAG: DUF2029 domain-containing protein [Acidimicrobiia bacterium]|nr:DUF2029 domain-containing protein [Acidimicrobiia bacterium]
MRFGPWLVVGALVVVAFITGLRWDAADDPGRLGGAFPSFYAAATVVIDGDGHDLYDPDVQRAAQEPLLDDGRYLFFAYPPYTAAAYAPLGLLPYGLAFAVHTALAVAALVGALVAVRPLARGFLDGPWRLGMATLLALAAYPVLRSVMGGQNATFSLLLVCLIARWTDRPPDVPAWSAAVPAGLAAAALMFKPQLGIIVLGILAVARRWRVLTVAVGLGLGLYGVAVLVAGPDWVRVWFDAVRDFGTTNLDVNGPLMVSVWGWVPNILTPGWVAAVSATVIAVAVSGPPALAVVTRRWTGLPWYALAPMIVLVAPSALYYEATLLVVTVIGLAAIVGPVTWLVLGAALLSWIQVFALEAGWSPLFIPILAAGLGFAIAAVRAEIPDHGSQIRDLV